MSIDENTLGQWQRKLWREPDATSYHLAIWYGPDGEDGDYATLLEYTPEDEFMVEEFHRDPNGNDFITQRVYIPADDISEVLRQHGVTNTAGILHRWAVGLGVAKLAYYGGSEDISTSLPLILGLSHMSFWDDGSETAKPGWPVDNDLDGVRKKAPAWVRR